MSGGWWIDYENLLKVQSFAEACDYSLARAAGMLLAIPREWGDCGYLGCATLLKPMKAFVGKGKPATGRISPDSARRVIPLLIRSRSARRFLKRAPGTKYCFMSRCAGLIVTGLIKGSRLALSGLTRPVAGFPFPTESLHWLEQRRQRGVELPHSRALPETSPPRSVNSRRPRRTFDLEEMFVSRLTRPP